MKTPNPESETTLDTTKRSRSSLVKWAQNFFRYSPGILQFIHIVRVDRLLILALFLVVSVIAGTTLFVVKIWTTTPKDFKPEVKVSLLDQVQAWSLRKSAREYQAGGDNVAAATAWASALANNLADVSGHRRHLETLIELDADFENRDPLLRTSVFWLAKLTQTNRAEMPLLARSLSEIGDPVLTLSMIGPQYDESVSEDVVEVYGRALFEGGKFREFREFLAGLSKEQRQNDQFRLYELTITCIRSDLATSLKAERELEGFLQHEDLREQALALLFDVAAFNKDLEVAIERLRALTEANLRRPVQTLALTQLLVDDGQLEVAKELLSLLEEVDLDGAETARRIELLHAVGEKDLAEQAAEAGYLKFGHSPFYCLAYSRYLIASENWARLILLSSQVRANVDQIFAEYVTGISYFWEGLALLRKGHPEKAKRLFAQIRLHTPAPSLALFMAAKIRQEGFPEESAGLYSTVRGEEFGNDFQYWFDRFLSAYESMNAADALLAAEKAYELKSDNLSATANYCAALLVNEVNLPVALSLAQTVRMKLPGTPVAALNYGLALAMNQRSDEALTHLKRIRVEVLNAEQQSLYWYIFLVASHFEETSDGAKEAFESVSPVFLMPAQRERLARIAEDFGLVETEEEKARRNSVLPKNLDFLR